MSEINWYAWAGLWLAAWFWQNMVHELSHLWSGWVWEGRKPVKLVPWMHRYKGRWYWARYECGPATENGSPSWRYSSPIRLAAVQVFIVLGLSWLMFVFCKDCSVLYMVPFVVCPVVDAGVWLWGLVFKRQGTDGDLWRRLRELESRSVDKIGG